MKYTKEQLEKIDFGRCNLDGLTVSRQGTVLALFNGDECLAVKFSRGWVTDKNDIGEGLKIAYAIDAVDAFVKSELERIEKDDVPVYPGDLITCECRGVKFRAEVNWVKR